ncbi:MAG: iron ABC transporter permease [Oscillospiraceae bacterium]|nr:iron ABC transporter permease [Oscillospiraceae bacterium]
MDKTCSTYKKQRRWLVITGLLVIVAFFVSLTLGRYPLSIADITAILTGQSTDPLSSSVFFNLRLPRTAMALLAGLGLGMAGSVFQLVFKNPLAAPDIVGVSSGANLGAAIAIVLLGQSAALMTTISFVGGMSVLFLVIFIARLSRNQSTVTFILAGIIMKAVSDALIMTLKYFADPERELASIEYWAMGSLGNMTAAKLLTMLPFFILGFAGLILMRRQIMLLVLEDDEIKTLGVRLGLTRMIVLGLAALVVSSIISQTGLIAFAGLIAPHAARLAIKRISFTWCLLSSLTGALILLISDSLIRSVSAFEIPISIPTTLIGVPVLLFFMWRRKEGKV